MTNDKEKERLLEEFKEKYCFSEMASDSVIGSANEVFDFFYSEIEARDAEINHLNEDVRGYRNGHEVNSKRYVEALSKISHLESIIQAADKIIVNATHEYICTVRFQELLNEYNELKKQQ